MTFSDKRVAEIVNANFVAAWFNRGKGFHNEEYSTEQWIFTSAMEAYTTKNICTFFLTPEGKVFHYVAGYYAPDVFLTYLEVALRLRSAGFDDQMRPRLHGAAAMRRVHGEVVKVIADTEKRINAEISRAGGWKKVLEDYETHSYRSVAHSHTEGCARNLHEGYRYLTRLHAWWSEAKELPTLESVQFDYLWGNPFTEESPGTRPIGGQGNAPELGECVKRCGG